MLALAVAATVKIGVFGLFHPAALDLRATAGQALIVEFHGKKLPVERGDVIHLRAGAKAYGRRGGPTIFTLSVPGKIQREFQGTLEVKTEDGHLMPVIEMDREVAVAAIAGSELAGVPLETMKAQAVAARSFLTAAKGRHAGYDFCDTTHCQHIRGRPRAGTISLLAATQTRNLALTHEGKVLAALYSANCGGHTHSLQEIGWKVEEYPYFGVACPIKGAAQGHGVGLCQRGATELARRGATFREILAYFFPATSLESLP